jgi:hypothetical protein
MYQALRENFSSNSSKELKDKHWKRQKSSNPVRTLCWKKSYLNVNLSLGTGVHRHEKLWECLCASWTQIKYAKNQSHSPLPNHSLLMMFGLCGRRHQLQESKLYFYRKTIYQIDVWTSEFCLLHIYITIASSVWTKSRIIFSLFFFQIFDTRGK